LAKWNIYWKLYVISHNFSCINRII
jgi:hypothetical protein